VAVHLAYKDFDGEKKREGCRKRQETAAAARPREMRRKLIAGVVPRVEQMIS
jgi:hypothetical protein